MPTRRRRGEDEGSFSWQPTSTTAEAWRARILIGLVLSAFLVWLAFRDIDLRTMLRQARDFPAEAGLLCLAGQLVVQFLHWTRWGFMARQLGGLGWRQVFSLGAVGNAALYLMPARLGEVVRPTLMVTETGIDPEGAVATSVVERGVDGLAVSLLLLAGAPAYLAGTETSPLASWGIVLPALFLAVVVVSVLALYHEPVVANILDAGVGRISKGLAARLKGFVARFFGATRVLAARHLILPYALLTAGIWVGESISLRSLVSAVSPETRLPASLHAIGVLGIANLLPSAPARVGVFEYAVALGLRPFSIAWADGLLLGAVFHVAALAVVVACGLAGLWLGRIRFERLVPWRVPGSPRGSGPS